MHSGITRHRQRGSVRADRFLRPLAQVTYRPKNHRAMGPAVPPGQALGPRGRLWPRTLQRGVSKVSRVGRDIRNAHPVLSLHTFDVDVEMELSHSGDKGVPRLSVNSDTEGGILLLEPAK